VTSDLVLHLTFFKFQQKICSREKRAIMYSQNASLFIIYAVAQAIDIELKFIIPQIRTQRYMEEYKSVINLSSKHTSKIVLRILTINLIVN